MNYCSKDVLKKLEEWQREQAVSSSFLESYKDLLAIQAWAEERISIETPGLSRRAAKRRLDDGSPMLKFDDFKVDWDLANEVFKKVIALFSSSPELSGEVPAFLASPDFRLQKGMAMTWFNGTEMPEAASEEGMNGNVMKAIIHATLKPFLAAYSNALIKNVETDNWRKGYCPVCGGAPDISFIEEEAGERWLMCSRCDAQWRFQRLECPSCGNKDHKTLSYFSDETEVYRLYVCDKCHTYLKAVDMKKAGKNVCLPVERLLTFDMDVQGQQKGYNPFNSPSHQD